MVVGYDGGKPNSPSFAKFLMASSSTVRRTNVERAYPTCRLLESLEVTYTSSIGMLIQGRGWKIRFPLTDLSGFGHLPKLTKNNVEIRNVHK